MPHVHLVLLNVGTSKTMEGFFAAHATRVTNVQLPTYSPDFNPIEYLWKTVKKMATHLKHFPEFTRLQAEVDKALLHFATRHTRSWP
jgi:transposase